jgi:IS5 family transposase
VRDAAASRRRGRLARAVNDLADLLEATAKIVGQARQRIAGITPDGASRVVSLQDRDARPIAKGRLGKPVEFGYKAQVVDNDDGIVVDHDVHVGRAPRTVTADRGYSEAPSNRTSPIGVSALWSSRAKAGPAPPARKSRNAQHSAGPSNGEQDAKAGSAPSNADTAGTAPAWTA